MRKSFLMESFYKKTLGCLILAFLLLLPLAKADSWWNTSWQYRKAITIDNTANSNTLTDYQVLVTLDTTSLISDGKMRTDCGDIRLTYYNSTDDSEKEIPQWVWTNQTDYSSLSYSWWIFGCNTPSTRITVKVPYIPANSYSTIYIYYGNSQAISTSSLLNVYDDNIATMSATLPSSRTALSCAPYGDSIYCFGGIDNSGYLNQIIRYDVISDSITVMSSTLPSGRTALSCAPYGDSIYCFGGSFLNQIVRYAKKYTPPDPTYSIGVEETPPPTTTTTTTTTTTLPPVHGVPLLSSTLVGVVIGFGIITFMLRMLFDIREPKKVIEYFIVLAVIVLTVLSLIALFA